MAQDFNNIPAGLNIPTQIPLNIKENVLNEATLAYLGLNNNLALTYHDQMIVTCLEEGTRYIWREVLVGEENTGLIPLDFTYSDNIITYGIDYSNRTFNFFLLPSLENKYDAQNIGIGESIYKDSTITEDLTIFNFKKVNSDSLTISTSIDGDTLNIEQPDDGIQKFIVDSRYTGIEELGTESKPFKSLQNALNSYKGTGTNTIPEYEGAIIDVRKDTNTFIGNLAYRNLNLIYRKGTISTYTPSVGQYSLDIDSDAVLPVGMSPFSNTESFGVSITLEDDAQIILTKQGFKNRGTNLNTNSSLGKTIRLLGSGHITIDGDASIVSPSIRTIISANADNQIGFFNDGNVANFDIQCNLNTRNTKIVDVGLNAKVYFSERSAQFGDTTTPFNESTYPYLLDNGTIVAQNYSFTNYNSGALVLNSQFNFKNSSFLNATNCDLGGNVNYLLNNLTAFTPNIVLRNCSNIGIITLGIIHSPSVFWANLRLDNNYFYSGMFNYSEGSIFANALNFINGQIVETLSQYATKAAAVTAGLFSGCSFIKTKTVNAVDLLADIEYKILTSGSPSLGTVGTYFTATGSETGTGTAILYTRETII